MEKIAVESTGALRERQAEALAEEIDRLEYDLDPYGYGNQVVDRAFNITMHKSDLLKENESLELTIICFQDTVLSNASGAVPGVRQTLDHIRAFLGEDSPVVKECYADWFPPESRKSVLNALHSRQEQSASAGSSRHRQKSKTEKGINEVR